ncbi:unnamed protein product [Linum trigynum]|uniref:F-box domain-containing protein n=1 Tax=Linum trigynum TaxID=586398 RepID=A0AAV2EJD0_9ROSI
METTTTAAEMAKPKPAIDADDRLSSLPDEVITHILSFLQTKYAVGTAVLSRRWKDLWTRVSNLDLDNGLIDQPMPGNVAFQSLPLDEQEKYLDGSLPALEVLRSRLLEFSRFVDRVLSQHRNLDSLRRFRFNCSIGIRERELRPGFWFRRKWVFGPLLEEIDMVIEGDTAGVHFPLGIHHLPQNLYTLKNLRVLKLEGVSLDSAKTSIFLPSAKILQLREVTFWNFETLSSLFSGCPALETAILEGGTFVHGEQDILMVSLPSLKKLKMIRFGKNYACPVVIEARNLEELELQEFADVKFVGSSTLSCLLSANIDIGRSDSWADVLHGVLNQIRNAKKMFITGKTMDLLRVSNRFLRLPLPIFQKLTHLTIGNGGHSRVFYSLLNSASKLQSLIINLESSIWDMEWEMLEHFSTPECLLSSLEEVEIKDFPRCEHHRIMIAYLLKVGAVLKKMDIHVKEYNFDIEDHKDLASLLKLPRGSSHCEARVLLPNNEEISISSDNEACIDVQMDDDFDVGDNTDN